MNYEVINMTEKKVAGLKIRTNNFSETMKSDLGNLWQIFANLYYQNQMPNKVADKTIGLYTNYAGDHKDDFDAYACYEVSSFVGLPKEFVTTTIKGGKFAKFVMQGEMHKIMGEFWSAVWEMPIERTFSGDFEEYQNDDMENALIHFYIAIK